MAVANSVPLPFRPGHTFWSPRVRVTSEIHTINYEGHEYTRREDVLQVSVKHKTITRVDITVTKSGQCRYKYWAHTVGDTVGWPTLCNPSAGFATETTALDFARYWRDTQGTEYFGGDIESGPEDPVDAYEERDE